MQADLCIHFLQAYVWGEMLLYSDSCSQVEQITGKIGCIMAIYEYQIIHISAPVIFPLKLYTKYTGFDIIKVHVKQ